jgi:GNAT superfamily N-acetyltransferase
VVGRAPCRARAFAGRIRDYMTVKFASEKISDPLLAEVMPLLKAHFDEIDKGRPEVERFNPDVEMYKALDAKGVTLIYSARDDGKLVGYCILLRSQSHQHKGLEVAHGDVYFVLPKHRYKFIGLGLLGFALADIDKRGIRVVRMSTSERCDTGPLLRYLGFEATGTIYTRVKNA